MRFEYKYVLKGMDYDQIRTKLMLHPAGFRIAFPDRQITSLYFDDVDFRSAFDNLSGSPFRIKYRIRWYGEMIFPFEAKLEQKIKKAMLGYKLSKKLWIEKPEDLLLEGDMEQHLQPVSLVSYKRTYLISFDSSIRATIDTGIKYKSNINDSLWHHDPDPILELKCDQDRTRELEKVVDALKLRRHKNSKYIKSLLSIYR